MSSSSRLTAFSGRSLPNRSTSAMAGLAADFVQEVVQRLADALQPSRFFHRKIGVGDVPAFCADLIPGEIVLRLRSAYSWPTLPCRIDDVQVVGNLCREVVDVRIPIAIVRGGEEHL